jgi:hypothetical protein
MLTLANRRFSNCVLLWFKPKSINPDRALTTLCRTGCTIDVANSLASGTEPLRQYAGFARRILIPQAVGLPSASGGYRRVFGKTA